MPHTFDAKTIIDGIYRAHKDVRRNYMKLGA